MNKKANTILFMLGATAFNILITIASFLLLLLLYARLLMGFFPETSHAWAFFIIFIAALVISFFVYRVLIKYLVKKIDMDKYFDPLFVRKNLKKPNS